MADIEVLQSPWAKERRHTDGVERILGEDVGLVADAGFAGVGAHWTDRAAVRRLSGLLGERGLVPEGEQAKMRRALGDARALHGRVASRGRWSCGLERLAARLPAGRDVRFACALAPEPHAITGRDGNDTTDRRAEARVPKARVEDRHPAAARPAGVGSP